MDSRAYKLMLTQMDKEPPEAGAIFPLLKEIKQHGELFEEVGDDLIFKQTLAAFSPQEVSK